MAKYDVTYACGHEGRENIIGPMKNRQWIADRKAAGLCSDCYLENLQRKREEENRKSTELAKEQELPELVGSLRQIAFSQTCRQKLLKQIDELIESEDGYDRRRLQRAGLDKDKIAEAIGYMLPQTSASWWIDNSREDIFVLLSNLYSKSEKQRIQPILDEEKAALQAETTVRPENPKTENVAEIRIGEGTLVIVFPEKRDDFRKIMKEDLHMEWSGSSWRRKLIKRNGAVSDRAAEAGHWILAAGFPIRLADQEIRDKAIRGEYEPECTRWILRCGGGEYGGWFAILWSYPDDLYDAARRLSGSKYSKPFVVVPPEQFEEVLDFAQIYGFRLSEKAREVAEMARNAKEAALIVDPEPPKQKQRIVADTKPPVLVIPEEVNVDAEFRDEN